MLKINKISITMRQTLFKRTITHKFLKNACKDKYETLEEDETTKVITEV